MGLSLSLYIYIYMRARVCVFMLQIFHYTIPLTVQNNSAGFLWTQTNMQVVFMH